MYNESSPSSLARLNACCMQCKILKFRRDGNVDSGCPCRNDFECRCLIDNDNIQCRILIIQQVQKEYMFNDQRY